MNLIRNKYFHFILLALAAIIVYSNTLNIPFQYDDKHVIQWNNIIKSPNSLPEILTNFYRPILRATFALNYRWFKFEPAGYHVFNIIIHVLNGILIYVLVSIIFKSEFTALLSALLFILHPLNSQAVNYISARSTSLCATFYILSVILFIKANSFKDKEKKKSSVFYIGTFLSCIVALGVKEIAVSIPVMLFACYCLFLGGDVQKFIKKYLIFILLLAGYLLYRLISSGTIGDYSTQRDIISTILTNCNAIVYENLKLLFFPVKLNISYEFPVTSRIDISVIISILVITGLIITAFKSRDKMKSMAFCIFWFFIALLPTQTVIPREEIIDEQRLYLASPAVCIFMAVLMNKLKSMKFTAVKQKFVNNLTTLIIAMLLIIFAFRTYNRNVDWQSEVGIWKKMAEHFPLSAKAHSNLGNSYAEKRMYDEAIKHYEIILGINPDDAQVNNNLANIYFLKGNYDNAIKKYIKAISLRPGYMTAYHNLAMTYEKQGLYDEALKVYMSILQRNPNEASAYFNMGNVFQAKKFYDRAIEAYKKAISIQNNHLQAYNNLGNAYFYKGMFKAAVENYKTALSLEPDFTQARDNMNLAIKNIK